MTSPEMYERLKVVSLAPPIRIPADATIIDASNLNNGSYMKNCFPEHWEEAGRTYTVKRPGLAEQRSLVNPDSGPVPPNNVVQGALSLEKLSALFYIIGDCVAWLTSSETLVTAALPSLPQGLMPFRSIEGRVTVSGQVKDSVLIQSRVMYNIWTPIPFTSLVTNPVNTSAISGDLVPSLSELNTAYYVMTTSRRIYNSVDGLSWGSLDYITLDDSLGVPICLIRHLTYLVAFCSKGTVVFYDAGISPGSPLLPVQNAVFLEGMAWDGQWSATSSIDDELFWIGSGQAASVSVLMMTGLTITKISTPDVDRILEKWMKFTATYNGQTTTGYFRTYYPSGVTIKSGGHSYYILTFPSPSGSNGITLVYDIGLRHWTFWTQVDPNSQQETAFKPIWAVMHPSLHIPVMFDTTSGKMQKLSQEVFTDLGLPIKMKVQTELYNWGNQRRKFVPAIYLESDTKSSFDVGVDWTDNDYEYYCLPQVFKMVNQKRQLLRCGSMVRRGWRLTYDANTPMRWNGLLVEIQAGSL